MTKYEAVVVISATLPEDGIAATLEKVTKLISKHGAVESVDEWGKRKLAYEINDEGEGYYVVISFDADSGFPSEFNRVIKITDGILRHLVIRKEV